MAANLSPQALQRRFSELSSGKNNNRNVLGRRRGAQFRQQILSIAVRHEIVGHDHGGFVPAGASETLMGVAGVCYIETTFLEPACEKSVDVVVVVDQQHARTPSHRGRRRMRARLLS